MMVISTPFFVSQFSKDFRSPFFFWNCEAKQLELLAALVFWQKVLDFTKPTQRGMAGMGSIVFPSPWKQYF